ncbi:MAG: nucleoside triphosphate pyrophosphohydrolase family protein [Porticoccaceae bacterium]|nr:nucleoside triphosphate pyrophosphohydrolase family protein [Porticoccaceae bacterium]
MKDVIGGASYEQLTGMFEGFDWYQTKCSETVIFDEDCAIEYLTMGLCSEAGEVAGKVKKKIRDGEPADYKDQVAAELGDVFWYLAVLTDRMGLNLSDIAFNNLNKLYKRKISDTLKGSGDNR